MSLVVSLPIVVHLLEPHCREVRPDLRQLRSGHFVKCHYPLEQEALEENV